MPHLPAVRGLYPFKFAYNMIQMMLCSYMCIEAGVRAYTAGYSILPCNKFNTTDPPIAFILYVFYISKILDFLDTFFIIAEKRFKQLSFLHVYHHTSIFLVSPQLNLLLISFFLQLYSSCLIHFWQWSIVIHSTVLLVELECWLWRGCLCHNSAERRNPYGHVYILLRITSYKRDLVEICSNHVSDGAICFDERTSNVLDCNRLHWISSKHHDSLWILHSYSLTVIRSFLRYIIHDWGERKEEKK